MEASNRNLSKRASDASGAHAPAPGRASPPTETNDVSTGSTLKVLRPRTMRLAFYGRTALFDPQTSPVVIRRQLDKCAQAAERLGGEITAHYWDVRSGRTSPEEASDPPPPLELDVVRAGGIADLLRDAARGLIDTILVERIDRVSRVSEHVTRVEEELKRHDVGLVAADPGTGVPR
jgi:DNA invertase Pin-like site-specific DNA recombinase